MGWEIMQNGWEHISNKIWSRRLNRKEIIEGGIEIAFVV
jgi:hypothetical protein